MKKKSKDKGCVRFGRKVPPRKCFSCCGMENAGNNRNVGLAKTENEKEKEKEKEKGELVRTRKLLLFFVRRNFHSFSGT